MSLYGRIFAAGYDVFMKGTEASTFGAHRTALLGGLSGRVVEIGGGTGANLPYYGAAVTELAITEPEEPMARRLERKLSGGARRTPGWCARPRRSCRSRTRASTTRSRRSCSARSRIPVGRSQRSSAC